MMTWQRLATAAVLTALLGGCSGGSTTLLPATHVPSDRSAFVRKMQAPLGHYSIVPPSAHATATLVSLCTMTKSPMKASCLGSRRVFATTDAFPDAVAGLTPNDLSQIYDYPAPATQGSANAVIGIVVAYDNPNAESDLAAYRAQFALPACTSANGCFLKVGAAASATQYGSGTNESTSANPDSNASGWASESAADVETVSAVCPGCRIVLAEAASDDLGDLGQAVAAAVNAGATVVNASFGAPESTSQLSLESAFEPAGVKVVAATGDDGPQVLFPSSATNVVAVAGTTLNVSGSNVSESLWSGSGGGCSKVFRRNTSQPVRSMCRRRNVADVAAVADPNTGLAIYDTASSGWTIIGGTSVAAPIIAGMIALSGDGANGSGASNLYGNAQAYSPVSGGGIYTGLGTPYGLSAF